MNCCLCKVDVEYGFIVKNYRFCSLDCFQKRFSFEDIKKMFNNNI